MHLRLAVPRIAALTLVVVLGSLILQPTTLRAETSSLSLNSADPPSTVVPQVAPEVYQGSFKYTTVTQMLAADGVTLDPADRVSSFPDPSLGIGSQIRVYRAPLITINDAGTITVVHSWATTVAALAAEQRLNLADQDQTVPALTATLVSPETITITRVSIATIEEVVPIPFSTSVKDSADLDKGVQQIQQVGKVGSLQQSYTIRRENGVQISKVLSSSTVLTAPAEQVVIRGTKITNYGTGGASWYGGVPPLTAANKTLPKGTKVSVVNLANGKSVIVTIDDRGPYVGGRVIDLSPDAFAQIASLGTGVIQVRMDKVYSK